MFTQVPSLISRLVLRRNLKSQHKQSGVTPPHRKPKHTFHPWTDWLDLWTCDSSAAFQSRLSAARFEFSCLLFIDEGKISSSKGTRSSRLSMKLFVSGLFVMVGFINTDLHLSGVIYSVSWMPEKQICLPSARVEHTLSKHSIVLAAALMP